jgi:hypothetical protein
MSSTEGIVDSTIRQVGKIPTPQIVTLSQAAINHLRVAQNKHNDPILRERAMKELTRLRGQHEEIDRYFDMLDRAERAEKARKRMAALVNPIR